MRDGPPPASLARVLARAGRPAVRSSSRPFEVVEVTAPPVEAPDPGAPLPRRTSLDPLREAPADARPVAPEPRAPRPDAPGQPVPPVARAAPRDRGADLGQAGDPREDPPTDAARLPDVEVTLDAAPGPRPAVASPRRAATADTDEHGHAGPPEGRPTDWPGVVDHAGEARQPALRADPAPHPDPGPAARPAPHGTVHPRDPTVLRTTSTADGASVPLPQPDASPAPPPPPVVIERIDITTPPATAGATDPLASLAGRRRGRTHHPRTPAR